MADPAPEIKLKPVEIIIKKYFDRTRNATYYLAGVLSPKRSPTEAAISMKSTLVEKMKRDETWEKWEKRRKAAGDTKWRAMIELKGVASYPRGTEVGSVYMLDFLNKFLPHLSEGLKKVYKEPRVTIDDSVKRAEIMIRHNHEFTYEPSSITVDNIKATLEKIKSIRLS